VGKLGYRGQEVPINQGRAGPVAQRLFDELTGVQYGHRPDPYGWTRVVRVTQAVVTEPLPAK
jgi:branched-chain amino acid aminotransferase